MTSTPKAILAAAALVTASVVAAERDEKYTYLFPWVVVSAQHSEYRDEALRFAEHFFGKTNCVQILPGSPGCCVWIDSLASKAPPAAKGYVVIHLPERGTTISVSSTQELAKAVDRLIALSRDDKGSKVLPVGLITSFPIPAEKQ